MQSTILASPPSTHPTPQFSRISSNRALPSHPKPPNSSPPSAYPPRSEPFPRLPLTPDPTPQPVAASPITPHPIPSPTTQHRSAHPHGRPTHLSLTDHPSPSPTPDASPTTAAPIAPHHPSPPCQPHAKKPRKEKASWKYKPIGVRALETPCPGKEPQGSHLLALPAASPSKEKPQKKGLRKVSEKRKDPPAVDAVSSRLARIGQRPNHPDSGIEPPQSRAG